MIGLLTPRALKNLGQPLGMLLRPERLSHHFKSPARPSVNAKSDPAVSAQSVQSLFPLAACATYLDVGSVSAAIVCE
jgi:hypothetical protein